MNAPRSPTSYHWLITRSGDIWELVNPMFQAWHAGESEFQGRRNCDQFMYGLAFLAAHDSGFTDEQYVAGAALCRSLMGENRFPAAHIVGHEHVAHERIRPDFKRDPGPLFQWDRIRCPIAETQAPSPFLQDEEIVPLDLPQALSK